MPPKKKAVAPENAVPEPAVEAVPPVSPATPAPSPPEAKPTPAKPKPEQPKPKGEPMIKSKGIAALISLFLPGVGLILCNPARTIEGIVVFVIALILDILTILISLGGPVAGQIVGGMTTCCLINVLSMGLVLGLAFIPVIHILAALHTYMRG